MNESREIINQSLSHKSSGKLPIDFGSTAVSGLHVKCINDLLEHYGIKKEPVKVIEPYQMLGEICDELKEIIGIDTIGIPPHKTMFGFKNENWKTWQIPQGLTVQVPEKFSTDYDDKGNVIIYPEGDKTAKPSGRMPKESWFFDTIIRQEPIIEEELDYKDNLEEFKILEEEELNYYKIEAEKAAKTGKSVVATFGGLAFGDIALVPAPFLKNPKGIRDIEEWYMSTLIRQDYIHKIFESQVEIALQNLEKINLTLGKYIDVVFICGTDFGTQTSSFCSVETFNELYKPYYKKINNWIHSNTGWKTMKHSCGAIESFIPSMIESGFDILNPVQISASGMDPKTLKLKYGKDIVFWGGGVDTQKTLMFSNPNEVYSEVIKNCEIFSENGGYVFNTVHNVQANVPLENILAMINALNDFNK